CLLLTQSGHRGSSRPFVLAVTIPLPEHFGTAMRRRELITFLGGAAATWQFAVQAQQGERTRHIGVLMYLAADDPEGQARLAAFAQALKQLGWNEGRNLRIETPCATADDIPTHARALTAGAAR